MDEIPITVPEGLPDLMKQYVVTVLRQKPDDLLKHAAEYFTSLHNQREGVNDGVEVRRVRLAPEDDQGNKTQPDNDFPKEPSPAEQTSNMEEDNGGLTMEEEDVQTTDSDEIAAQYAKRVKTGRKSVSAERYDPNEDMDDDEPAKIVPKSDTQRKRLRTASNNVLLLNRLEEEQLQKVLDAMDERQVVPDETVIEQGDDGDNFYIIEEGTFAILIDGNKVGEYCDTGFFGELALLYNMPRAATIKATTAGTLWSLDRKTFRQIIVKANAIKRTQFEEFLKSVEILQNINEMERAKVADVMEVKKFKTKEIIIKQGDQIDSTSLVYFVMKGSVSVEVDGREVKQLEKGAYFGELALLSKKPRAATITAVSDEVVTGVLDVNAFERLLGPCKELMERQIGQYQNEVANTLN